ncbi:MAG: hemin-degrading factor [Burkholderiales bacterium]|nr:hemin-degrading factor [Burkholderiales bacterium]
MDAATYHVTAGISLRTAWDALRAQQPIRQRDAADLLGVSEGELVASRVGAGVTRLAADLRHVLKAVPALGRVMALTRNDACVHEKIGVYENLGVDSMVGIALGEDIDLRLFFTHWKHGFAVSEAGAPGGLQSLQFFDATGQAVHKIFLKEGADHEAYEQLVTRFAADTQVPGIEVTTRLRGQEQPDGTVDVADFREAWANLKDTHEFFWMLKRFGVTRMQAMRFAGYDFAHPVPLDAARTLLDTVAASALPIMVFAGNPGCIQIHTGPVQHVKIVGPWLNVLDAGFNLHLRTDRIASAWVVRKPTADGVVTSLELFDGVGETIAMFFGKRKPGLPEMAQWQATIEALFPVPA